MVKVAMVHHVDALALVEFALDVEEELVHGSALNQLVDEPEIFLVVDGLDHHADIFLLVPRAVLPDQLGHLQLNVGRRIELIWTGARLGELLHREGLPIAFA